MRVNENVRIDQTLITEKCIKFSYYMFVTVTVIKGHTNNDFVVLLTRRLRYMLPSHTPPRTVI